MNIFIKMESSKHDFIAASCNKVNATGNKILREQFSLN